MTHDSTSAPTDTEVQEALDIARKMIKAGIPIFSAPPCAIGCGNPNHPKGKHHYKLPRRWEDTYPSEVWLDRWEPGYALAAVGGRVADFLDVDPRNGGDVSARELQESGGWPRTFGRQRTPSGGYHDMITATGQRKYESFVPGVDLQSGGPDGQGRGFVYLAPTVGVSKVTGELVQYRWEVPPDLEGLEDWAGADHSTERVVALVQAKRAAPPVPRQREVDTSDPFATEQTLRGSSSAERFFTREQAMDFCRPSLAALQQAEIGRIEECCNTAAATLSHFVPDFWSVEQAFAILSSALSQTAYDPDHPASTWQAEKFLPVLSGKRPVLDPWKARLTETPAPVQVPEPEPEKVQDLIGEIEAALLDPDQMADRPAPDPLVYGLLDMDTEAWMIGAPGSFKSFVLLDLAAHVGAGREWHGHRVRQGSVFYIVAEGETGMTLRVRAWRKEHGPMTGVTFLPLPVQVSDVDRWAALVEVCRRRNPSMIIIDTQARVTVGLEENSAKDMGYYIRAVSALRAATRACVLTSHHTGRDGKDARGSSAIDGAQDTELKLVRATPRESLVVDLRTDKQKDMEESADALRLQLRRVDLGEDPVTGRHLSSLIVSPDDFEAAQGQDRNDTRPWLPAFHHRDRWRQTILNALYDFAPVGVGLTEAKIKEILIRDAGLAPKSTQWGAAWKAVLELRDPDGEPVVANVGGQRYDLTSLSVLAAMEEEHGPRGGTGSARDTP